MPNVDKSIYIDQYVDIMDIWIYVDMGISGYV